MSEPVYLCKASWGSSMYYDLRENKFFYKRKESMNVSNAKIAPLTLCEGSKYLYIMTNTRVERYTIKALDLKLKSFGLKDYKFSVEKYERYGSFYYLEFFSDADAAAFNLYFHDIINSEKKFTLDFLGAVLKEPRSPIKFVYKKDAL